MRIALEQRRLLREPPGQGDVVGVHPSHDVPARSGETATQRGRDASSVAGHEHDPAVSAGESRKPGGPVVARCVVDRDELERDVALGQDAACGFLDGAGRVAERHENGDERHAFYGVRRGYGTVLGVS